LTTDILVSTRHPF